MNMWPDFSICKNIYVSHSYLQTTLAPPAPVPTQPPVLRTHDPNRPHPLQSQTTWIQRTCPPLQSFPQSCGLAVWVETWTTLPTDVRTFTGISARDASAPIRQSMTGWVMWIARTSGTWSAATAAITRKKSLMLSTNICLTSSASSSQTASTRWLLLN